MSFLEDITSSEREAEGIVLRAREDASLLIEESKNRVKNDEASLLRVLGNESSLKLKEQRKELALLHQSITSKGLNDAKEIKNKAEVNIEKAVKFILEHI
jgi:vacuolar-type H+-ATPase subunit H